MWTRETDCCFCGSEEELEEWERIRLSGKFTQFRRTVTGTPTPRLALVSKSAWAAHCLTQAASRRCSPQQLRASAPLGAALPGPGLPAACVESRVEPPPAFRNDIRLAAPDANGRLVVDQVDREVRPRGDAISPGVVPLGEVR